MPYSCVGGRPCKRCTWLFTGGDFKQSVEDATWFLLSTSSKIPGKRGKLRKEPLNKRIPVLDNRGHSHPTQIPKDAKISRFVVRKVCSEEKAPVWPENFLFMQRDEAQDSWISLAFSGEPREKDGIAQVRSLEDTFV